MSLIIHTIYSIHEFQDKTRNRKPTKMDFPLVGLFIIDNISKKTTPHNTLRQSPKT